MEARAVARGVRLSPKKVRQVLGLIRGKDVSEAFGILRFTPKRAAKIVEKVLKSAVANAENNYGMNVDKLYVALAYVNQGPVMKRIRPVSMGRAHPYRHYTSHITVTVRER